MWHVGVAVWGMAVIGWCLNIYKLAIWAFEVPNIAEAVITGTIVLRGIGVLVVPMGSIMGFF